MKPLMVKSMTIMTTMMFVYYGGANWNDDAVANILESDDDDNIENG